MNRLSIAASILALILAPAAALGQPVATPAQVADPARLAAARVTVDYVFPAGTYARVMNKSMDTVMGGMMDSVGKMSLRDIAALGGVPQDKLATLGDGTLKEVMAIYDPHYEERMQVSMHTMMGEMSTLMTTLEPAVRDGLAHAYAKRFSAAQLAELNGFFATPTGKAYAADSMIVFMDPEVMAKMTDFMPALMKQMPAIKRKLDAAVAALPPPRKLADLTPAERARLTQLLGEPPTEPGQHQDNGLVEVK